MAHINYCGPNLGDFSFGEHCRNTLSIAGIVSNSDIAEAMRHNVQTVMPFTDKAQIRRAVLLCERGDTLFVLGVSKPDRAMVRDLKRAKIAVVHKPHWICQ